MLVFHWKEGYANIHLVQERSSTWWDISDCSRRNVDIKPHLMFIHAFSGCDTTSSLFGKGKTSMVKLIRKSKPLQQASNTFNTSSDKKELGNASVVAFQVMCGGSINDTLATTRYVPVEV